MIRLLRLFLMLMLMCGSVLAQTLPSGYIGTVTNNAPYTWQTYTFTFTPTSTGSNFVMLAFRQDPAYWSVDNIRVTAPGSTNNLLTNGDMTTGGSVTVQTNSGTQYINAPTAWGVGYQNGTYPAAAGTWMNSMWYDGAVGSFDSIYQAINLTAGVTYTIKFDVNGDNISNGSSVQLGVYAGACSNLSMAPTECTLPSSSGFTQIATPSQTYTAGCTSNCPTNPDTGPTVVSTSTSNQTSTSSSSSNTNNVTVTNSTTTNNYTNVYVGTTTVTTTTTTPVTTTTWSDGSTTTSNGTPTSTSVTTYTITPTPGTAPTYSRTAPNTTGNSIYVKQVYAWNNTQVTLEQNGNNNAVTGTDSGWATVDGNGSLITVKQSGQSNIVGIKMNAWGNNIDIRQGTSTVDANNNILNLESFGNGNSTVLKQESNTNTASIKMTYDINTVNLTQKGGPGNTGYVSINGNWNTVNDTQNGANNLSIINISGDQNNASVTQTGNNHSTLLNLIGNKNTVSVVQTGIGDTYSLQQTCTNPAGCSVSVIRNR
jgi:Curlin associated repeat